MDWIKIEDRWPQLYKLLELSGYGSVDVLVKRGETELVSTFLGGEMMNKNCKRGPSFFVICPTCGNLGEVDGATHWKPLTKQTKQKKKKK